MTIEMIVGTVVLALVMVLAWLLVTKKIKLERWTWEDEVILAARVKRFRKNQRRIKENNPMLHIPKMMIPKKRK